MSSVPTPRSSAFPDSPYAAELQRGGALLGFGPELEAEYLVAHLRQCRTLIRVSCVLGLALVLLRGTEQAIMGAWTSLIPPDFAFVLSASLILTFLAWSPAFERHFLGWAGVIVPIRNAILAFHVAAAASRGLSEMLIVLPLLLLGPFFFIGLRFRAALLSGIVTVLSFAGTAIAFDMDGPLATRVCTLLLLSLLACSIAARHLEKASRTSFLENHLIEELAQHDGLTGTKNRRVFDDHLSRLWLQAIQDRRTIAILLIDIDHFKAYNDRYGHQAGDQTLRRVAQVMQESVLRPLDVLARYGGEEFVAVLYDVEGPRALDTAERLRRAVEMLGIEHGGSRTCPQVTVSVGLAVVEPTGGRDPGGALQLADQALYHAKVKGRNRVELMNEAEYRMLVTGVFDRESSVAASG